MNELHLEKPSTVKMIKPIVLLLTLFFSFYADAAVAPDAVVPPKLDFTKIKAKDIERITGKKLTLFQKVEIKIAQKLLRKLSDDEMTDKQKQQAETSLILGTGSLALLLLSGVIPIFGLLCIPAAILAIVFGSKSLKGNSNTKGIIGVVTGGVTLAIILLAIIIVLAFFASWGGIQ
jgi:hypothetical protein